MHQKNVQNDVEIAVNVQETAQNDVEVAVRLAARALVAQLDALAHAIEEGYFFVAAALP